MTEYIDRVRGSRRKKIEEGVRKAGYIKIYSSKSYSNDFCIKTSPEIDPMKLAESMGIHDIEKKRILSKRLRNKDGLPLDTARLIIDFLEKKTQYQFKYKI